MMRPWKFTLPGCALLLLCTAVPLRTEEAAPATPAHAAADGTRRLETVKLVGADRDALRKLFAQFAQAMQKNSAEECLKLFAPLAAERNKLVENIRNEFTQTRYTQFEIVELRTDDVEQDMERRHVYTVDVVLRIESVLLGKDDAGPERRDYTTTYPFTVQRFNDGTFALRFSEFFKTLGLRQGPRLLLQGLGLIAAFSAVLTFWVWMGWEAWRERPRSRLWRGIVILPVGALFYFIFRLVPRWVKAK